MITKYLRWNLLLLITLLVCACQHDNTQATASEQKSPPPAGERQQQQQVLAEVSGQIVFQSDRDGDWDIYVMNLDGSGLVQLTHNDTADEYPVWSPDGTRIAYKSNRGGNFDIYVMNADGTHQRRLTDHPANDEDPAWSPDGKLLAFHSERTSRLEIYFINPDGSGLRQFTETIGKNGLPAWSPDGSRIAYTGNRYLGWNVYVTDLNQTDDVRITDGHGACRPDWSPDSSKLAYVSQRDSKKSNIWIMNPDGSERHRLTDDDENYDYYPAWSPDGKYLVYAKSPDKDHGNWELYLTSADGTQNIRLTNHPARDKFPDWYGGSLDEELVEKLSTQREFVYEAEFSPRTVGEPRTDKDASGGQAVVADRTAGPGFVAYGPYAEYAPGNYGVRFRVKIGKTSSKEVLGFVDVAADAGQTILARQDLFARDVEKFDHYQDIVLEFSLQASQIVEFRVFSQAVSSMAVDRVRVQNNMP